MILKRLGYDGEYQRATVTWRDSSGINWVTPSTPAAQLGYGSDD